MYKCLSSSIDISFLSQSINQNTKYNPLLMNATLFTFFKYYMISGLQYVTWSKYQNQRKIIYEGKIEKKLIFLLLGLLGVLLHTV